MGVAVLTALQLTSHGPRGRVAAAAWTRRQQRPTRGLPISEVSERAEGPSSGPGAGGAAARRYPAAATLPGRAVLSRKVLNDVPYGTDCHRDRRDSDRIGLAAPPLSPSQCGHSPQADRSDPIRSA
eukprot:763033-Hanusia_phi.AAC.2